ncbi:MAG: hypothetical protein AMXMBFR53_21330 [Gemmatimonadota bacterium]
MIYNASEHCAVLAGDEAASVPCALRTDPQMAAERYEEGAVRLMDALADHFHGPPAAEREALRLRLGLWPPSNLLAGGSKGPCHAPSPRAQRRK